MAGLKAGVVALRQCGEDMTGPMMCGWWHRQGLLYFLGDFLQL